MHRTISTAEECSESMLTRLCATRNAIARSDVHHRTSTSVSVIFSPLYSPPSLRQCLYKETWDQERYNEELQRRTRVWRGAESAKPGWRDVRSEQKKVSVSTQHAGTADSTMVKGAAAANSPCARGRQASRRES